MDLCNQLVMFKFPSIDENIQKYVAGFLESIREVWFCWKEWSGQDSLLRCISDAKVKIPEYITCLHVEQEVGPDCRSSLQAVLESDVVR